MSVCFVLPEDCALWESVATVAIVQSYLNIAPVAVLPCSPEYVQRHTERNVYSLSGIPQFVCPIESERGFDSALARAYRKVEDSDSESYVDVLAKVVGLNFEIRPPVIPSISVNETGGIVLCPGALKTELSLPINIWHGAAKLLRTYLPDVTLLGERIEGAHFFENDIYADCAIQEQLELLARAQLVVGVPNEWLWIAFGMKKKIICLYPDNIPSNRWLPWTDENIQGRLLYTRHQVQVAIVNYGLRKMIAAF